MEQIAWRKSILILTLFKNVALAPFDWLRPNGERQDHFPFVVSLSNHEPFALSNKQKFYGLCGRARNEDKRVAPPLEDELQGFGSGASRWKR